jgi:hypothetical protein
MSKKQQRFEYTSDELGARLWDNETKRKVNFLMGDFIDILNLLDEVITENEKLNEKIKQNYILKK